jgi:hypothetical protein
MTNNLWIQPEELGDYAYTEFATEAAQTASYLLWAMSGRKYTGITTVTERYTCVLRNNRLGPSTKTNSPVLFGGDVYNIPSGDYDEYSELTSDGMSPDSRLRLRGRPVTQVHTIRNRKGDVLDPSSYYLVDHSTIHIKAGTPWTPCNTEVTYSYGTPVPVAGKMAARKLAMEFAKLWAGDDDCALPQRVTSVSRQGVSYTILDNQEFIDELRTGLYEIDLFLKVTNPDNARRKAKVFSPDQPRARRYTPKSPVIATTDSNYVDGTDIYLTTAGATWDSSDTTVDVGIFSDPDYVPRVSVYNYSGSKNVELDASNVDYISGANDFAVVTIPYSAGLSALGMIDPGTWTLYAVKTVDGIEEIVTLVSGNISTRMY